LKAESEENAGIEAYLIAGLSQPNPLMCKKNMDTFDKILKEICF